MDSSNHVAEETSLEEVTEDTESTFTSKVVNKIASLMRSMKNLLHLQSMHLPKSHNTSDQRESSTEEHRDNIMKRNN